MCWCRILFLVKRYLKITVGLVLCGAVSVSWAQDHTNDKQRPAIQFQFGKSPLFIPASIPDFATTDKQPGSKNTAFIKQYGATLSIPVKHDKVSFDLGLDFRFYETQDMSDQARDYSDTYSLNIKRLSTPMVYANALFDLPFQGLTASVSGRHRDYGEQKFADFDYRAELSYEWKSGIGLQGGWQHQQMSLESQNSNNEVFRVESLFVDMKYKF